MIDVDAISKVANVSIPTTVSGGLQFRVHRGYHPGVWRFNTDNGIRRATISGAV